jgi:MarR family transcriptional regulator, organic hydroperoxide resistance regulator
VALTDKGRALREQAVSVPEKLFCALDLPLEALTTLRERLKTLAR